MTTTTYHVHMTQAPVIEIGESFRPSLFPIASDGSVIRAPYELELYSDNFAASVENGCIVGKQAGEASLRAIMRMNGESVETTVTIRVIAPIPQKFRLADGRRPHILFNLSELNDFLKRVTEEQGGADETSSIPFHRLWRELLNKADAYTDETAFEVRYANAPDVLRVELPLKQLAPLPEPQGYIDYPFWTMYSRAIEERLTILSAAYLTTKESKYGVKIREYLLALAGYTRWYEFDHRGAEGNLSNAHFTIGVSTAYDAVWSFLSPEERDAVRQAVLEKGLRPLAIDFDNRDLHNIIAAKQVAMMFGSLAILDEEPYAHKYLNQAYDYLFEYLNSRLHTHETEGLMYNNVAARHVLMAGDVLRRATGDETLSGHEYLKRQLPDTYFYFIAPGKENTFPNFSDSFLKLDLAYMMSMLASNNGNPVAMWYVETFERDKTPVLLNLQRRVKAIPPEVFFGDKKSMVFPSFGWAALRSGWGEKDHLLGFTSSPSDRGHNHKDQNNFMVNVAGEWLLTNPGYQDYVPGPRADYTTGTVGHNSLLINNEGQPVLGGGRITDWFLGGPFQTVTGDATDSYDGLLKGYERLVLHVDNAYYVILDRVRTEEPGHQAELLFHTTSEIISGGRSLAAGMQVPDNAIKLKGQKSAIGLHVAYPPHPEIEVKDYKGAEQYGPYLSVKSEPSYRSEGQHFVTVLEPLPDGRDVSCRCEASIESGNVYVEVQRGGTIDSLLIRSQNAGDEPYVQVKDLSVSGNQAWVSRSGDEAIEAYALVEGTKLVDQERTLVEADKPVSMTLERTKSGYELRLIASGDSRIRIHVPDYRKSAAGELFHYDHEKQMLEAVLGQGEHRFSFQLGE